MKAYLMFYLCLIVGLFISSTTAAQVTSIPNSSITRVNGAAGGGERTSSGSFNFTLPTNMQTGDVTFLFTGQSDSEYATVSPSGQWSLISENGIDSKLAKDFSSTTGNTDVGLKVEYLVYTAGDNRSFTVSAGSNRFYYYVTFRGVDPNNPIVPGGFWRANSPYGGRVDYCNDVDPLGRGTLGETGTGAIDGSANGRISSAVDGVHVLAVMFDDPVIGQPHSTYNTSFVSNDDLPFTNEVMNVIHNGSTSADAIMVAIEGATSNQTSARYVSARNDQCLTGSAGDNIIFSFTLQPNNTNTTPVLIDACENANDPTWGSDNGVFNNSSKTRPGSTGNSSVRSRGSGTDDFRKTFAPKNAAGNNTLRFWYYVVNKNNMGTGNQVELSSNDTRFDREEYSWTIDKADLQEDAWNEITLPFSSANTTGGAPDPTSFKRFRLYRNKSGEVVSRIDDIMLITTHPKRLNSSNDKGNAQGGTTMVRAIDNFTIAPNPAQDQFKLYLNNTDDPVTVRLFDLQGRLWLQETSNEAVKTFQVRHLPAGIYALQVANQAGFQTTRLVIE